MGRRTILRGKTFSGGASKGRSARQRGWSLIEMTVTLCLLMAIALFGMKTMVSAWMMENWSIGQSMTDAYAGVETAYAQRYVFADIENGGTPAVPRWGIYPAAVTATSVPIGYTPSLAVPATAATALAVNATVVRTYHKYTDLATGAVSYLLESYVLYQSGQRKYCKVSKVYRIQ